jgi:hypothetical protein
MPELKQITIQDTKPPTQKTPTKIPTQPIPPTNPTPKPTSQKEQYKPIPRETKIILDALQDIEGILYATRQQILQLYGPVDYSQISDVESAFSPDITNKLSFELKDNTWIIRPKAYLGSDLFRRVAETVKEMGGEYISDPNKKDSHFQVKRK